MHLLLVTSFLLFSFGAVSFGAAIGLPTDTTNNAAVDTPWIKESPDDRTAVANDQTIAITGLGSTCVFTSQCQRVVAKSVCFGQVPRRQCRCEQPYLQHPNENKCLEAVSFGKICEISGQCPGKGICRDGRCGKPDDEIEDVLGNIYIIIAVTLGFSVLMFIRHNPWKKWPCVADQTQNSLPDVVQTQKLLTSEISLPSPDIILKTENTNGRHIGIVLKE